MMRFFLILVCLTASLWSTPTLSHAGPFGRMRDSQMQGQVMQKMQEALDLSDAQKKQIEPIVNSSMEQFKELRNLQGPEKKTKAVNLVRSTLAEISPILTPAQRKKVTDMLDMLKQSVGT